MEWVYSTASAPTQGSPNINELQCHTNAEKAKLKATRSSDLITAFSEKPNDKTDCCKVFIVHAFIH